VIRVPAYTPPAVVGEVKTRVWSLAMPARPPRPRASPPRPGIAVVEAKRISASFYRYLYDTVGAPWCWTGRRLIGDEELLRRLHVPGVEVDVLWVEGVPAGYAELSAEDMPAVWIAYFGLLPEFIGHGLGRYLLDWSVDRAWDMGAAEVRVQTCDLDHPAALPNYQRAGFRGRDERVEMVKVVAGVAVSRRGRAPS
jgi:GNAT superfamily N-acetyltransferase